MHKYLYATFKVFIGSWKAGFGGKCKHMYATCDFNIWEERRISTRACKKFDLRAECSPKSLKKLVNMCKLIVKSPKKKNEISILKDKNNIN